MKNIDNNCSFLSSNLQDCFFEIFNYISKENEYMDAVAQMTYYFADVNNDYDFIVNKYPGINKELLIKMVLSNFLEINYYRLENNIEIDDDRKFFIEKVISYNNSSHMLDLLCLNGNQIAIMINDVLLYFWHLSPIYSYNAVMSMKKSRFDKYLNNLYPLAKMEHSLTMMSEFSDKEYLLFTLYECIVNEVERIDFANGNYPSPDPEYLLRIKNQLYQYNGTNNKEINLYKRIINKYRERCSIDNIPVYKKLLITMCEALLKHKKDDNISYEDFESKFMEIVNNLKHEDLFDKYGDNIIGVFLDNLGYVDIYDIINSQDPTKLSLK